MTKFSSGGHDFEIKSTDRCCNTPILPLVFAAYNELCDKGIQSGGNGPDWNGEVLPIRTTFSERI